MTRLKEPEQARGYRNRKSDPDPDNPDMDKDVASVNAIQMESVPNPPPEEGGQGDMDAPRPDKDEQVSSPCLLGLPDEILLRILSHLSADNALDLLGNVSLACRRLRSLSREPCLWVDVGVEVDPDKEEVVEEPTHVDVLRQQMISMMVWAGMNPTEHEVGEQDKTKKIRRVERCVEEVGKRLHAGTKALRLRLKERREVEDEAHCRIPYYALRRLFKKCPRLESLRISGIRFRDLDCSVLPNLRRLSLSHPQRLCLSFESAGEMERLRTVEIHIGSTNMMTVESAVLYFAEEMPQVETVLLVGGPVKERGKEGEEGVFVNSLVSEEEAMERVRSGKNKLASPSVVVTEDGRRWRLLNMHVVAAPQRHIFQET